MTQTDALEIVRRTLGPTGYLTVNTKAPRDPDTRKAAQDRAGILRNEVAGIDHAMKLRTKQLQDDDLIYQAMLKDRTNTIAALNTAQDGARWRYTVGFRYRGAIFFDMSRQIATGANCQHAIDNMRAALESDPSIVISVNRAKKGEPRE
jgi:hypothetical protein